MLIICEKSGLKFEAENRRRKTHPEIAFYTQHKDSEFRYFASKIIEQGKINGWDSIEKFKSEINLAWEKEQNSSEVEQKELYECNYIAQIVSSDSKYRFQREFITAESETTRKAGKFGQISNYRQYDLSLLSDGYYEVNHRSAKGNDSRYYWLVNKGEISQISLEEVEKLFPKIALEQLDTIKTTALDIPVFNSCFELNGQVYKIVDSQTIDYDEDGFSSDSYDYSGFAYSETTWEYIEASQQDKELYFSKKTDAQLQQQEITAIKEKRQAIINYLKETDCLPLEDNFNPQGEKIIIHENYSGIHDHVLIDKNCLWAVYYNGRDGDNFSLSNWQDCYIVNKYPLFNFLV